MKPMSYDYFPEEFNEATPEQAQEMLDAYNAGKLEFHPEMLRIVKRTANEKPESE